MRNFANLASLAVVAIGFTTIVGGNAFAAVPNRSNDAAYDTQVAAQQNGNSTTEQSFGINSQWAPSDTLDSHPNEAHSSTHQSNGNS